MAQRGLSHHGQRRLRHAGGRVVQRHVLYLGEITRRIATAWACCGVQ